MAFFVKNYILAISVFGTLLLFGLLSLFEIGVDLLPEVTFPVVSVMTAYPGAGPEGVSAGVGEVIEGALTTLPDLEAVTSTSSEGLSRVVAYFSADADPQGVVAEVSRRLDGVAAGLPDGASAPVVRSFDPDDQPILSVAVAAPGEALYDVQTLAENDVALELRRARGVADVTVVGPATRELQVLLDPAKLTSYALSPQAVVGALRDSAVTVPTGDFDLGNTRILLVGRNVPESLSDIEAVPVDLQGVRVRDVAVVRDTTVVDSYVRLNGEPVVLLEVRKRAGANAVATAARVREVLSALELPAGTTATVVGDDTSFVSATVRDTLRTTLLTVGIVAFMVLLFIGRLGTVFSVTLAIPLSLSGTLIAFALLGFTFNVITLLAIIVTVGIVVDDSIVIAENISRYRELGFEAEEAVLKGTGDVAGAVLASTLSLLAVFLPISFLPGEIGPFFRQFALTLAFTITFSYLEAFFFLTVRMAYLPNPLPPRWGERGGVLRRARDDLRRVRVGLTSPLVWLVVLSGVWVFLLVGTPRLLEPYLVYVAGALLLALLFWARAPARLALFALGAAVRALFEAVDGATRWAQDAYARSLDRVLGRAALPLVAALALFASLFFVGPRLGYSFMPTLDAGRLVVNLELPAGTSIARTDEVARVLEGALMASPLVTRVQTLVGSVGGSALEKRPEHAGFAAELVGRGERPHTNELAVAFARALGSVLAPFPEAVLTVEAADTFGPPGVSNFELNLASADLKALEARSEAALALIERKPYLRNAASDLGSVVSERVFLIDNEKLVGAGLSARDVYTTLRLYNVGLEAATMRLVGADYPVRVKADPAGLRDEGSLLSLPIFSPLLREALPLGAFGAFEIQAAPSRINRTDGSYSAALTADLAPGAPSLSQVRSEVVSELRAAGLLDDGVELGGGNGIDLTADLAFYMPIAFGLALLLNYLVIASQFNSFRYPLYILLTVPLALVGAVWLFFLTKTSLDVTSVLGFVILIGLVTKTAILLLDAVTQTRAEGAGLREALIEAGRLRLRPILMTSLTIVAISIPLLFGGGEGGELRRPLGLAVLGGVFTSALLTLYVVPAVFYLFERGGRSPEPSAAPRPVRLVNGLVMRIKGQLHRLGLL